MGIFKPKKSKMSSDFSQEVPDFKPISEQGGSKLPDLPKSEGEKGEMFPSYQREFSNIKREIAKPTFTAPMESSDIGPTPTISSKGNTEIVPVEAGEEVKFERVAAGDKPIYVKMDQYKDAMQNIDKIKELCNDADKMLSEISRLRSSEDRELEKWQDEVDKIKDKILLVDKKLFEI